MAAIATVTIPIYAHIGEDEYHLGDISLDLDIVSGHLEAPGADDLESAFRKASS